MLGSICQKLSCAYPPAVPSSWLRLGSPALHATPHPPQQRAAEQRLLAAHGAHEARDVHVRLHVLEHSARLAFLPAFHLQYQHGEAFNAHGERVPARFEALISGTGARQGGWGPCRGGSACMAQGGEGAAGVPAHLPGRPKGWHGELGTDV